MSILLVGVNHKTAPVEIRERLAFNDEACANGLRQLVDGEIVREGLIVSTCNRVEILGATASDQLGFGAGRIAQFLDTSGQLPPGFLEAHLYHHTDEEAVRHLFRVASSLDSMVVGEPQVLGQVRHAYALGVEAGTVGRVLNRLVHHTFKVAKRVRSETGIAASAVSISYMAVELGKKIFDSLKGCAVLLIGAGEMAELSARHLVNAGAARVIIANRTEETARQMADEFGGDHRFTRSVGPGAARSRRSDLFDRRAGLRRYRRTSTQSTRTTPAQSSHLLYRHQRAAKHRSGSQQHSERLPLRHRRPRVGDLFEHS